MDKGKIAELYQQAHIEYHQKYASSVVDLTVESIHTTRVFNHELFAEMIVKKCMELGDKALQDGKWPGDVIKEHFGVE